MPDTLIPMPDMKPHELALDEIAGEAVGMDVVDVPTQERAESLLSAVEAKRKAALAVIAEPKAAAHKLHKFFTTIESGINERADSIRAMIEPKLIAYEQAERRKAEEESRRLQEEARKREEEERINAAIAAESAGVRGAERLLDQPSMAPAPVVAPAFAANRSATQTRTRREVTDLIALVRFVAENPKWVHLLEASSALARVPAAVEIPGTRMVETQTKVVRTS